MISVFKTLHIVTHDFQDAIAVSVHTEGVYNVTH
jgi:hypothetical protein